MFLKVNCKKGIKMKIGGIKIEDRRDKDIQQTENSIESPRNISKKRVNRSSYYLNLKENSTGLK